MFSPAGGGLNFIREVENEIHHSNEDDDIGGGSGNRVKGGKIQPPSFDPASSKGGDFFDV